MLNEIRYFNDGTTCGYKISEYGLENGYLDYRTLANILGGCILNNSIIGYGVDYWEIVNGCDYDEDENSYSEIFQYYIISESGAEFLQHYTDEIVYYNEKLDIYLWGITHWGTSWDNVLTNVKLVKFGC